MNNYYKEFSEIRQDMSAEEIRQELNRQNVVQRIKTAKGSEIK